MKKYAVAAALALMFVWTPKASAQDMTVATYKGMWTPIGQLPAGVRHVTKSAQEVSVVLQVQTKNPQGQLVLGGEQIQWKNIVTTGTPPVDNFSFGMELRPDYWVSCTLAKREADGSRYSGLCWDEAHREGWMQLTRRAGATNEPESQQGRPDEGR
ncbi:MAG: hypothetical protein Q8W45_09145 [Candidatus Palauibacterales bacterium]|nr:hypothetical protein [Candidatus Palauibacterales bacterium]MDP2483434.1 hypothetical protein [Candidatus Palauibacterales bacterium]